MTYETDRDALIDDLNRAEWAMRRASEWARIFVEIAPQSGCHLAALARCLRADRVWREADDALVDFDDNTETRAFHVELVRGLVSPTDAEIDAAQARMDHLLGPGWLEAVQ